MPNSLTSLIHLVAWYKIQVWSSQQNSVVVFSVCDLNSWHWNRKIGKFGYWLGLTLSELISCSPHGTSRNLNPSRSPDFKIVVVDKKFSSNQFSLIKEVGNSCLRFENSWIVLIWIGHDFCKVMSKDYQST